MYFEYIPTESVQFFMPPSNNFKLRNMLRTPVPPPHASIFGMCEYVLLWFLVGSDGALPYGCPKYCPDSESLCTVDLPLEQDSEDVDKISSVVGNLVQFHHTDNNRTAVLCGHDLLILVILRIVFIHVMAAEMDIFSANVSFNSISHIWFHCY